MKTVALFVLIPFVLAWAAGLAWLAVTTLEADVSAQAPLPPTVDLQWETASVPQSASIPRSSIAGDLWMSASEGATTTVFWVLPSGFPDSFAFVPDDGRWSVGAPTLPGDLDGNGVVNIFDAISLLQIIVGLR